MIEINNQTSFRVDKKLFTGVAKKVLKGENREREKISLAFISKEEIKKLNKKFRGKNKPTDVLSFDLTTSYKFFNPEFRTEGLPTTNSELGEIVICPEVVKENSGKNRIAFEEEIIRVFMHGILHLLGYNHEKSEKEAQKMEAKEKFYLNKI